MADSQDRNPDTTATAFWRGLMFGILITSVVGIITVGVPVYLAQPRCIEEIKMGMNSTTGYPPLRWSMIEAFLDWDVARVNRLIEARVPRSSSEWRITDNHVRQFYKLMMAARNGDQP